MEVKIIALDLDGTLLNSKKQLSSANRAALQRASREGIEIVPATGRIYSGIPAVIRELDFIHYAIVANGARVLRLPEKLPVYMADIPLEQTLEVMRFLDTFPVIYDCYTENEAWVSERFIPMVDTVIPNPRYRKMFRDLRKPVPELKRFLEEKQTGVMKSQILFPDESLRDGYLELLRSRFPNLNITSSVPYNVEINSGDADKGKAVLKLAEYLRVPVEQTVSFGDGLNDLTMLSAAGTAVAMGNAEETVKEKADLVAPDCDSDGVAAMLKTMLHWDTI